MTDSWPDLQLPSLSSTPNTTPVRASRKKGITNETAYPSFTRTSPSGNTTTFRLGDPIIVGPSAQARQKWLQTPAYLVKPSKGSKRARDGGVIGGGWRHEDGLKAGQKVAVIVGLCEDVEGRKLAKVRWFARPGAVWSGEGPDDGDEVLPYELYYTSDSTYLHEARETWTPGGLSSGKVAHALKTPLCTDTVLLEHITSHASIYTPEEFIEFGPGVVPTFFVSKVFDAKPRAGGQFFGEIKWSEVLAKGMRKEDPDWDVEEVREEEEEEVIPRGKENRGRRSKADKVIDVARKRRKQMAKHEESDEEDAVEDSSDDGDSADEFAAASDIDSNDEEEEEAEYSGDEVICTTPTKSRRPAPRASSSKKPSPKKRVVPRLTQHAVIRKATQSRKQTKFHQKSTITPGIPPTFSASPSFKKLTKFERAKALLHVSATPERLPRREEEREKIRTLLGDAILGQTGTCLYIHGVPGTGKTATVHSVVRDLQQDEDMDKFQFVEINGMKISEPNTAFSLLWQALSGQKSAPRQALTQLEAHFQTPDPNRKTTVVLVDELDQMITKKQDVIYNFFNWPHVAHSRLIVIAIANTMDLPERELSGKIRSRLGSNRIPFPSYVWQDLDAILHARLEKIEVFAPHAIQRIARLVAGVSGDARRALDIARRSVEKIDQLNKEHPGEPPRLCSMQDVSDTYKEMTNYGSNAFVKRAGLHQKVFLLALSQSIKRAGVPEVDVGDVIRWHLDFLRQTAIEPIPSQSQLFTVVAELHAMRLVVTDSQRLDYYQRVRALVDDADLFAALREEKVLKNHVPRLIT